MPLTEEFFLQPTPHVARQLLGKILVHDSAEGRLSGMIVETEAYLGAHDPASHTYRGESARNKEMFGPPGHFYIYRIYGMHYCINTVTAPAGIGEGVLIRALEPLGGLDIMKKNRRTDDFKLLCKGPARLVEALGITIAQRGHSAISSPLRVEHGREFPDDEVIATSRIGITKGADLPLRFAVRNSSFVSGPRNVSGGSPR